MQGYEFLRRPHRPLGSSHPHVGGRWALEARCMALVAVQQLMYNVILESHLPWLSTSHFVHPLIFSSQPSKILLQRMPKSQWWTNPRATISDPRPPPHEAYPVSSPPVLPDVLCRCPSCAHRSLHALRFSGWGTIRHKLAKYAISVEWSTSDPGAGTSSPSWHQAISGVHLSKRSPFLPGEALVNDIVEYLEYRALVLQARTAVVASPALLPYSTISLSTTMASDDSVDN